MFYISKISCFSNKQINCSANVLRHLCPKNILYSPQSNFGPELFELRFPLCFIRCEWLSLMSFTVLFSIKGNLSDKIKCFLKITRKALLCCFFLLFFEKKFLKKIIDYYLFAYLRNELKSNSDRTFI